MGGQPPPPGPAACPSASSEDSGYPPSSGCDTRRLPQAVRIPPAPAPLRSTAGRGAVCPVQAVTRLHTSQDSWTTRLDLTPHTFLNKPSRF